MAAGVGDAFGCFQLFPLTGQLRHAVGPAFRHPVGGGGVDDDRVRACDERGCLDGCRIRQAEKGNSGAVEGIRPGSRILTGFLRQDNQFNVLPGGKPLPDPQAGGAGTAVDKNLNHESSFHQMKNEE